MAAAASAERVVVRDIDEEVTPPKKDDPPKEDLYKLISKAYGIVDPVAKAEKLMEIFHDIMTVDEPLFTSTNKMAKAFADGMGVKHTSDVRIAMLFIDPDFNKYESYLSGMAMLEFIYHSARFALDSGKITILEYYTLCDLLSAIGLYDIGICKYPKNVGSSYEESIGECAKKEEARQRAIAILEAQVGGKDLIRQLELDKPIVQPKDCSVFSTRSVRDIHEMMDMYCRFMNEPEDGLTKAAKVMKALVEKVGILPGLNAGFVPLSYIRRGDHESIPHFEKRAQDLAEDIGKRLVEDKLSKVITSRVTIRVSDIGTWQIPGILQENPLVVIDKNKAVQAIVRAATSSTAKKLVEEASKKTADD